MKEMPGYFDKKGILRGKCITKDWGFMTYELVRKGKYGLHEDMLRMTNYVKKLQTKPDPENTYLYGYETNNDADIQDDDESNLEIAAMSRAERALYFANHEEGHDIYRRCNLNTIQANYDQLDAATRCSQFEGYTWPAWIEEQLDWRELEKFYLWFKQFGYMKFEKGVAVLDKNETDRILPLFLLGEERKTGKTALVASTVGQDLLKCPADNPYIIYFNGHVTREDVENKPNAVLCIFDDVKLHVEAEGGLKSVLAGRGGKVRYVGGQVHVPAMPVAIITNDVPMYNKWIKNPDWEQEVIWWRLQWGVNLIPKDKRPVRRVLSHVTWPKKELAVVGPGIAAVEVTSARKRSRSPRDTEAKERRRQSRQLDKLIEMRAGYCDVPDELSDQFAVVQKFISSLPVENTPQASQGSAESLD